MAAHNTLGKAGEEAVAAYLESQGYRIRHRNWRMHRLELDIVTVKAQQLVVVEVKTRNGATPQEPQESVDERKRQHIMRAANAYLRQFRIDMPVRFDIVTVTGTEGDFRIEHIPDAFSPCW